MPENDTNERNDRNEYLRERLSYHISRYQKKRNYSRVMTGGIQLIAIIIGSSVTVLLGLKTNQIFSDLAPKMDIAALVMSAIVTLVTGWETFADYPSRWIRYRTILAVLYDIRDDLEYYHSTMKEIPDEKIKELYDRLKAAIRESNEEWLNRRVPAIFGGKRKS